MRGAEGRAVLQRLIGLAAGKEMSLRPVRSALGCSDIALPPSRKWRRNFVAVRLAAVCAGWCLLAGAPATLSEEREWRIIETYGYEAAEPAEGAARGKQVYEQWCIICHDSGPGMAGTSALLRRYQGKAPALLTEREDLTAEYISVLVRQGVKSMPFFRKTEIGDEDLAALNLYLVKPPAGE